MESRGIDCVLINAENNPSKDENDQITTNIIVPMVPDKDNVDPQRLQNSHVQTLVNDAIKNLLEFSSNKTIQNVAIGVAVGTSVAVAAPFIVAGVLGAVGFTSAGVAAGSIAAASQTPTIAAGSYFAICQSLGAVGLSASAAATAGGVAGVTTTATMAAADLLSSNKQTEEEKMAETTTEEDQQEVDKKETQAVTVSTQTEDRDETNDLNDSELLEEMHTTVGTGKTVDVGMMLTTII